MSRSEKQSCFRFSVIPSASTRNFFKKIIGERGTRKLFPTAQLPEHNPLDNLQQQVVIKPAPQEENLT